MSIVLYALGIIVNVVGVIPDIAVNIAASVIYDNAKKIYNTITIEKGRNLNVLHPVIETALVNSFYNAIIFSLTKTRDNYTKTSSKTYKKEILQISARIKDLTKLLKKNSSSNGYSLLLDSFAEVIGNSTDENTNRLIMMAKNNLIGLPEKAKTDLENHFIGIFLVFFKEEFAKDDILKSLLTFDMLHASLSTATDTNKKIDSLILTHINIENELNSISSAVTNLPSNSDFLEIRSILTNMQNTLTDLIQSAPQLHANEFLLERAYRDILYNKNKYIELPFFDGLKRANLKDIYYPLELINRIAVTIDGNGNLTKMAISEIDNYKSANESNNPFLIEKMSIYDVLPNHQRAFILGEHGTGKTTTIKHIVCCLSGIQSTDSTYWNEERLKYGLTNLNDIPIYISLLDYYRHGKFGNGAQNIFSYIKEQFSLQEDLVELLKDRLLKGNAIVLVEDCEYFEFSASSVLSDLSDLIQNYSRCRYLIFSSSKNEQLYSQFSTFDDIPKLELSRLSLKIMREISEKFSVVLSLFCDLNNFSFDSFYQTIKEAGLQSLLEKPHWFIILLMTNCISHELPNSLYSMYIRIADNMLNRFLSLLDSFSETDKQHVYLIFELLSIQMFSSSSSNNTFSVKNTIDICENYLTSEKTALLINKIKTNNCELLNYSVNNTINYTHKPLISALIARYFKRKIDSISLLIDNTVKDPSLWIESLELVFDDSNYDLLSFVLFMLQNTNDGYKDVCKKISIDILSKVNVKDFATRPERLVLVKSILQSGNELISSQKLSIQERISVAENIALISISSYHNLAINSYFALISAGKVFLGNDMLTLGEPYEYNIDYDFYAGKFPVTNMEYQKFLQQNPEYPLPLDENNIWDVSLRCVDKRFLNHPVVGVNFHDALEFCKWLNRVIDVPDGYKVWLPNDAEWMKMYRGGEKIYGKVNDNPTRIYPWGDDWIEGFANLSKLKKPICSTTPVGIFVEGASIYGCHDVCGNVLEWTTTSWGGFNPDTPEYNHPYNPFDGREDLLLPGLRITRGGSFLFSEGDAKCSCRLEPESRFPDTGFRVFLVPINQD